MQHLSAERIEIVSRKSAMRCEARWDAARRSSRRCAQKGDGAAGLAARVDHGTARRRSYFLWRTPRKSCLYRARKRCFHCRVPRSQVEGMPCSPMTVDYRGRQEATFCHGSRCSAVANKKLLSMPHSTVRERRASSSQDVIPARCTEDRVAAESGLTLWYLSPCALWSLSL